MSAGRGWARLAGRRCYDDQALIELRELERRALVTSFPHAFGRPQRADAPPIRYYYPGALAPRADTYDEFIYFDHHHSRPWPDSQAVEGLRAVDDWYAARGGLPMSRYAVRFRVSRQG